MSKFPYYKQLDQMDCGPTCLRMVAKYHGRAYSLQSLRDLSQIGKEGVSLLGISEAAEKIGFRTIGVKVGLEQLIADAPLPCILHWDQNHFVVLHGVKKKRWRSPSPLAPRGGTSNSSIESMNRSQEGANTFADTESTPPLGVGGLRGLLDEDIMGGKGIGFDEETMAWRREAPPAPRGGAKPFADN